MDSDDLSYIGYRGVSTDDQVFGISQSDRRQHLYLIGRTGSGKTTLLRNLIVQDIVAGRGLAVIDPHGDLAYELLDYIPAWRSDDVVFFDPSDVEHPLGLNVLASVPSDRRPLVADNVVGIFRHLWGLDETATPRLLRLLYACIAALLDFPKDPGATLLGVPRMLVDERYRARVVRHVENPKIRSFWKEELPQWDKRYLADATAALGNVVEAFLTSPVLRNIFGQPKSSFSMRKLMDNRGILIVSLSKGLLGGQTANIVGSFVVSACQFAAMSRAEIGEDERVDFHLFVDEFQSFATASFAALLSEARKYRLCLALGNQYCDQISPEILASVLGNCGTLISFRVGATDAERLAPEFAPFPPVTLQELGRGEVVVRQLWKGVPIEPFFGTTMPPLDVYQGKRDNILYQSRARYGRARNAVEAKMGRWLRR
jgi:hypothetical protein